MKHYTSVLMHIAASTHVIIRFYDVSRDPILKTNELLQQSNLNNKDVRNFLTMTVTQPSFLNSETN